MTLPKNAYDPNQHPQNAAAIAPSIAATILVVHPLDHIEYFKHLKHFKHIKHIHDVQVDFFSFGPKNVSFSKLNPFPFKPKETKIREDNFYEIQIISLLLSLCLKWRSGGRQI